MGEGWIVVLLLIGVGLMAVPAVRKWWGNNEQPSPVDPEQNVSYDFVGGLPGWYEMRFRPRRVPRGRRDKAPQTPSVNRVRREPPHDVGG